MRAEPWFGPVVVIQALSMPELTVKLSPAVVERHDPPPSRLPLISCAHEPEKPDPGVSQSEP
jgi:hypothetical protein